MPRSLYFFAVFALQAILTNAGWYCRYKSWQKSIEESGDDEEKVIRLQTVEWAVMAVSCIPWLAVEIAGHSAKWPPLLMVAAIPLIAVGHWLYCRSGRLKRKEGASE